MLGFAESSTPAAGEEKLCFLGLMGMLDPPRPEVRPAVQRCREAGIKPVMITGDYKETALAIARDVGIARAGDGVLSGTELDALSDSELAARCMRVSVYARVSPAHKLRIVRAYKAAGQVVAMTGDGVIGQCHLAPRRRAMYRMHASKGYSKAGGRIQSTLRLSARTTVSGMVSPTGIEPAA